MTFETNRELDIKQMKMALFFTKLRGCKSALNVCVDLFMMEQTDLIKRIRHALKNNRRELALMLMEYWLSIKDPL